MKSVRLIALGAALALLPNAAEAASRHHKAASSRAIVRQPQDDNGSYDVHIKDTAGNPCPLGKYRAASWSSRGK